MDKEITEQSVSCNMCAKCMKVSSESLIWKFNLKYESLTSISLFLQQCLHDRKMA